MAAPCYRVETLLEFTDSGAPGLSVTHWIASGNPGSESIPPNLENVLTAVGGMWNAMNPVMAKATRIVVGNRVLDMSTDPPQEVARPVEHVLVTNVNEFDLPAANQLVMTWLGFGGVTRGRNGRTFFGPLNTKASTAEGKVSQDALQALSAAAAFRTTANGDAVLAIAHRDPANGGIASVSPSIGARPSSKMAILRSRRD